MQGSNWPATGSEPRNLFSNPNHESSLASSFLATPSQTSSESVGSATTNNGSQNPIETMYRHPSQDKMSAVLCQYANPASDPVSFRHPMFPHDSQIVIGSQANVGRQPSTSDVGAIDGHANQRIASQLVGAGTNLDSVTAAAVAAYGQFSFNASASTPSSQIHSEKGMNSINQWIGAVGSMMGGGDQGQAFNDISAPMSLGGSSLGFRIPGSGGEGDGSTPGSAASDEFTFSKKRRMTFAGAIQASQPSNSSMSSVPSQAISNNQPTHQISQQNHQQQLPPPPPPPLEQQQQQQQQQPPGSFTRPPFRHRRSRSGSEVPGLAPFVPRPFGSFDSVSISQSFPSTVPFVPAPQVFVPGHPHPPSFVSQPSLASLGGHAASHPPGLGSQILRGVDVSASGSSAASDFTKRKGWTSRVVEELLDFVHVLDPEGIILFASPSAYNLTGWTHEELRGQKLINFIHPQDVSSVEREIDRMRSSNGELMTYYRFKTKPSSSRHHGRLNEGDNDSSAGDVAEEKQSDKRNKPFTRDGEYIVFEATGHAYYPPDPITVPSNKSATDSAKEDLDQNDQGNSSNTNGKSSSLNFESILSKLVPQSLSQSQSARSPSETSSHSRGPLQCFFCSARPYPSKNTSMLDSFLELKLENEKLRLLIADMDLAGPENSHDKANIAAAYHPDLLKKELEGDGIDGHWRGGVNPNFGSAISQPDGRHAGNGAGVAPSRNNSLGSHPTSPMMRNTSKDDLLGGLGVSTWEDPEEEGENQANSKTAKILTTPAGATEETRRKKKPKQDDGDHVCTDCGRVDSPEWRKGPLGPKTLCNACGLRWAKKIKRKGGDPNLAAVGVLVQTPGVSPHIMPLGHPIPHGHPHPFIRTESSQLSAINIAPPPGPMTAMGIGIAQPGILPTSVQAPPGFASRGSFDGGQGRPTQGL